MVDTTFRTSGSTGIPKSFTVDDDFLTARAADRAGSRGAALADMTSLFCDVSPKSIAGVSYRMWAQANSIRYFDNGGGTMAKTLALFASEDIDVLVAIPSGLLNYARAGGAHRFKSIIGTGDTLSASQLKSIQAGLGENVFNTYGASEVGSIAQADAAQIVLEPGCVGALCPGVTVRFVDGKVQVKTPSMISGYDNAALNAQFFSDGWFCPGDLGHLRDDGLLVLDGRA